LFPADTTLAQAPCEHLIYQKEGGAKGFLAGIAMPALGLRSILDKRPLLAYF
jgi:hypothetical protein